MVGKFKNPRGRASMSNGFQNPTTFEGVGGYLGAIAEHEHNMFWGALAAEDAHKYRIEQ